MGQSLFIYIFKYTGFLPKLKIHFNFIIIHFDKVDPFFQLSGVCSWDCDRQHRFLVCVRQMLLINAVNSLIRISNACKSSSAPKETRLCYIIRYQYFFLQADYLFDFNMLEPMGKTSPRIDVESIASKTSHRSFEWETKLLYAVFPRNWKLSITITQKDGIVQLPRI